MRGEDSTNEQSKDPRLQPGKMRGPQPFNYKELDPANTWMSIVVGSSSDLWKICQLAHRFQTLNRETGESIKFFTCTIIRRQICIDWNREHHGDFLKEAIEQWLKLPRCVLSYAIIVK